MGVHFFKVQSRLGMINIPNGGTQLNLGVENGPDAVLTPGFLKKFAGAKVDEFKFPLPEAVDPDSYLELMAVKSRELAGNINRDLSGDEIQVVVGGDHSVAFASVLAVMDRYAAKKIGYLQFDSHGDIHLHKTSPSGNFHGMWLRPFLNGFDVDHINKVVGERFSAHQIMFVGNLELETEEANYFKLNHVKNIASKDFSEDSSSALAKLKEHVAAHEHIHISFDVDVFKRSIVSATGTPAQNGMSWHEILPCLQILKRVTSKSVDLVEVNPQKPGSALTIKTAQKVLQELV